MNVILLPPSDKELDEAIEYYNDQEVNLGNSFYNEFIVNVANVVLIFYNFLYSVQHCLQYQAYLSNKLPILFY